MVNYLKSSVAGAALLTALGAPALAASPPHSDNGAEDYEFVLPSYGSISAFSGATNPFYGGINPQYGHTSPFWGNISPFWGEVDPFYGSISAFWGSISAFEGDISPFWGSISAFWGEIGPFWGSISAFWGSISAFTEADFAELASDLDALFAEADAVFGPAIEAATGQSMEEAFLSDLKARYGIDTSDPHALAELDAEERSAFFLEFYDSLMGYTGADRVDHWMPAIGWTPALAQRVGGASGVTVGIVDFSLPYRMPGLRGSANNTNQYLDFNHGIAVAELIGADMDGQGLMGVAPNAAMRVENPFDETLTADWADVRGSLDRLLPQSDIVNLSLGVPGSAFSSAWADVFSHRNIARHASDTLFVFAAGNDGVTQTADVDWSSVGEVENLLIVGSVNPAGEISSFSNRPGEACLTTGGTCQEGHRLMDRFLVAPGELLLVPDGEGGVVRMSGTSFAAPLVSGAAALVLGRWNWLEPGDVAEVLLRSARDLGEPGVDPVYGWGLLDVEASFRPFDLSNLYHMGGDGRSGGQGEYGFVNGHVLANVEGEYVTLYEDLRDTRRDFQVSVDDINFGADDNAATNDGAQQYIEEQNRGNRGNRNRGNGNGRKKFSFAADSTHVIARSGDVTVTSLASRLDAGERATDGDMMFQAGFAVENAVTGTALRFGHGEGALSFSQSSGFGLASDHRPATGGVNPVLGFASGGAYAAGEMALTDRIGLAVMMTAKRDGYRFANPLTGESTELFTSLDAYAAGAVAAELRGQVSDQLSLSAGYTLLNESEALLGAQGLGDFAFSDAVTDALTLGAEAELPFALSLAGSATLGRTRAGGETSSPLRLSESILSTAFQVSLERAGVFGEADALRFSLIQPLHAESGAIDYTASVVTDRSTGALGSETRRWALSGERDLAAELLYAAPVFDGRAGFSLYTRVEAPEARFAGGEAEVTGGWRVDLDF